MNFIVFFGACAKRLGFAGALALSGIVTVVALLSQPALASPNLAYDELTKFVMTQSAPEAGTYANGSFAADFQAAVDAGKPQKHGGLFGVFKMVGQTMKSLKAGFATSYYFWGGLKREDDPANQTAKIYRPDKHQMIQLDLENKTYYIVDTRAQPNFETPPPYQRPPSEPQGSAPSPVPGTAKVAVTVRTDALGSKTIAGEQTSGYKLTFKVASTQATGSCTNGTFETDMVEYVSSYAEPTLTSPSGAGRPMPARPAMINPETMAMRPGCQPTYTAHMHVGPAAPEGRLALWELLAIKAGAQTNQGSASGGFQTLVERGNVRTLGPADKSLFEIPAGFTQAQPSPSPAP